MQYQIFGESQKNTLLTVIFAKLIMEKKNWANFVSCLFPEFHQFNQATLECEKTVTLVIVGVSKDMTDEELKEKLK